jgi:hypothetical protein
LGSSTTYGGASDTCTLTSTGPFIHARMVTESRRPLECESMRALTSKLVDRNDCTVVKTKSGSNAVGATCQHTREQYKASHNKNDSDEEGDAETEHSGVAATVRDCVAGHTRITRANVSTVNGEKSKPS